MRVLFATNGRLRMGCALHSNLGFGLCPSRPDIVALKHASSIFRQSSNPVCGFSMMEQVRLCAIWPMENWLGSSLNQIQVGPQSENPTLVLQLRPLDAGTSSPHPFLLLRCSRTRKEVNLIAMFTFRTIFEINGDGRFNCFPPISISRCHR